jgi:hypothetical protein
MDYLVEILENNIEALKQSRESMEEKIKTIITDYMDGLLGGKEATTYGELRDKAFKLSNMTATLETIHHTLNVKKKELDGLRRNLVHFVNEANEKIAERTQLFVTSEEIIL